MSWQAPEDQRAAVRRALAWALVAALCVAALTAVVAILNGGFDETDGRVIATSLGFAVFSATGASGASLRFREEPRLRTLGAATMGLAGASFLLLLVALWIDSADDAWVWFACAGLAALAASHASLVSGARRPADSEAVRLLCKASIGLGLVDSSMGILAISGAVNDVGDASGQLIAVLVILLLLTTALPPILRRLQPAAAQSSDLTEAHPAATLAGAHPAAPLPLATEVLAAADRIEALNPGPGSRELEIRRECDRLRRLAHSYTR